MGFVGEGGFQSYHTVVFCRFFLSFFFLFSFFALGSVFSCTKSFQEYNRCVPLIQDIITDSTETSND